MLRSSALGWPGPPEAPDTVDRSGAHPTVRRPPEEHAPRPPRSRRALRLDDHMTFAANATLADVGEFGLVDELASRFSYGEQVLVGPGDDAAVLAVPDRRLLVSTDLHVDTRHFRRDWATAEEIGHKVAAANLSDINAMGGR